MDNYLEKINENLLIIRKNSRLFILFGLLGIFIAIAAHNLIQNRYEAEVHLKINYPTLENKKFEKEINSDFKILILQARDQMFYTEAMQDNCNVNSYDEFKSNLKVLEVRGINSTIKINYASDNFEYSKKCLKEVIKRLDEIIKTNANVTKESLYLKNQIIEKNISKLIKEIELNSNRISEIPLIYFINKSRIDLMNQEYQANNESIDDFSKTSYVTQISQIVAYPKPLYRSALTLYSVVLAISFIIALCVSYLKEFKLAK